MKCWLPSSDRKLLKTLRLPGFEDLKPSEKLRHLHFEAAVAYPATLTVRTGDFADVLLSLGLGNRATPLSSYQECSYRSLGRVKLKVALSPRVL
jgi:hypothetical protein